MTTSTGRTFGIWIEGMPDGMIEPHWLPNDERTGDWTGSEEEATRRARYVGVAVEREPDARCLTTHDGGCGASDGMHGADCDVKKAP